MGLYPKIQAYDGGLEVVDVFRGLNRAEKISEGEWSEDLNLTSDRFPMLSVRKQRSIYKTLNGFVSSMLVRSGEDGTGDVVYAMIVDYAEEQDENATEPNVDAKLVRVMPLTRTIKTWAVGENMPKQMVSFGAYIVIPGLNVWYNTVDGTDGTIASMPEMDFVIESQNRLWGCFYGEKEVEENGETVTKVVNEIYASELGKFDSWSNYDGTSMASYAASVGTEGMWTGAISYQGKPHFFKEKFVHKVYISATGAHQIVSEPISGVMDSIYTDDVGDSLCEMDGHLYYVGRDGVYCYDGSTPVVISEELGDEVKRCYYASCGGAQGKLFVHFRSLDDEAETLYVYDVKRGLWHIEDALGNPESTHSLAAMARTGNTLLMCRKNTMVSRAIEDKSRNVIDLFGMVGTPESAVTYSCTSGLIGWQTIEQKYISRFDLRLTLPQGATMKVELEYDSSGTWEEQGTVTGGGTGSVVIPVRPRRCDHFRLRLSGTGEMRMYSWAKRLTKGSDVVL